MSCVMSVGGICPSDGGLKISPSQSGQTTHKCQTHRTLRVLFVISDQNRTILILTLVPIYLIIKIVILNPIY